MNKKVYLKAYMVKNLGDDLFLKMFVDRYGDKNKIYLYANSDYKKMLNNKVTICKNVFTILFNKTLKLITKKRRDIQSVLYKNTDLMVQIGGSLFMEKSDPNYKETIKVDYPQNTKYYLLGSNFGPYKSEEFLNTYKEVFKKAEDVCLRDEYSYNLFKDLDNVRYTSDIVYGLDVSKVKKTDSKKVVISVIDCATKIGNEYKANYKQKLKETIEQLVSKNYEIVLMSFCKIENDEIAINEIYDELTTDLKDKVSKYFYNGNIEEALNILGDSSVIIGTRFHANILGLILGKTIIPIAYSDKTLNALKDINFNGKIIDIRKLDEFNPDELNEDSLNYKISVTKQIESAQNQFEILDKELLN